MEQKKAAGIHAASFIEDGMIVGLGTGSTAKFMIEEVGRRISEENLQITGVTTSKETEKLAQSLNIPLKSIDSVDFVDITIDGADEVDGNFYGIKGGGAALLFEKIVATYSKKNIWIVDESKLVENLGAFPLPIEVIPYGSHQLFRLFETKGWHPTMRVDSSGNFLLTDAGHHIIDLQLKKIVDVPALASELDALVGVVEHGLFLDLTAVVIVGSDDGVKTFTNKKLSS